MNNTVNIFNFYSCILIRTLVPAYPPGIPLPMAFTTDRSRLSRRAVHVWTWTFLVQLTEPRKFDQTFIDSSHHLRSLYSSQDFLRCQWY